MSRPTPMTTWKPRSTQKHMKPDIDVTHLVNTWMPSVDNVRQETHEVSVHDQRQEGQSSLLHQSEGTDWREDTLKKFRPQRESPSGTRGQIPCRHSLAKSARIRSCKIWHPPYVKTSSLGLDAHFEEHVSSDMLRRMRSPAKSRIKVVWKVQLPHQRSLQLCRVSQDSHPSKFVLRIGWKIGIKSHRQNSPRARGTT